ncbi:serine hydrolase domain-containing protein [Poritiphilus flavus]|uniref:Serine hydrolase n=1 Tax=Poritiphilus flavus TaxID=2697053 RepID=A0A6L9EEQ5_9FLAO|nr:serine hydrolase [Poritiphilus flavus]NAS13207.1 serine hydrolase [Poritiphilus flavus]
MKKASRVLLIFFLLLIVLLAFQYPKLDIISGYAAKNMSSSVFLAKRTAVSVAQNDNNVPLISVAEVVVDPMAKNATATVFGLKERRAVYREGLGSVLLNGDSELPKDLKRPNRNILKDSLPFPYGNNGTKDSIFPEVDYQKLDRALHMAFSSPEIQKTRTVLVAYKDHIVAEKYIRGFDPETPILGWSMTKSILATLYGIMEYQGKIELEDNAPVAEWENDSRAEISYDHLLRMQSGLEWEEDYSTISDATRMFFFEDDMSSVQRGKETIASPTQVWNYSSGTSNLLSGILRDQFDTYQEYLDFPYRELIDKTGMYSMLIETDLNGTYVGSSYGWANTRDWAKFGLLYLHRGMWNGERIFAPEWVDYVSRPTAFSNGVYGAHFWLNSRGKYPDVPRDLYSANGYQGQYVFIIPSRQVVVVRTGLAGGEKFDVNAFLKGILAAFPKDP